MFYYSSFVHYLYVFVFDVFFLSAVVLFEIFIFSLFVFLVFFFFFFSRQKPAYEFRFILLGSKIFLGDRAVTLLLYELF